jgi:hypothetical protein
MVQLAPEELEPTYLGSGSTEVFSLGVLLWQCLANHWLFGQDSEAIAYQELADHPIPSLQTIERYGMPVPQALVELVEKATRRELDERYSSLAEFIAAIVRLPSHFVATEHQVGEALRQRARILVSFSLLDESTHATSGTFSEVPPSRTPTRPPVADAFGSEPPTFAQSRLITAFPPLESFDAPVVDETPAEYIAAEAISSAAQPGTLALALSPDQQLLPYPRKTRQRLHSWVFYSVLTALLLALAIVGIRRTRLLAPNTPPVKARITATKRDTPLPKLPNPGEARHSHERLPDENSTAKASEASTRDSSATTPNQQQSTESSSAGSPVDDSAQTPSLPTSPKKSKSVGPYRPKGI